MSDDSGRDDTEIIHSAYAERVKEAFKVFADNLGIGENEKLSRDRFLRALLLMRRARDLALQAAAGEGAADPAKAAAFGKGDEATAGDDQLAAAGLSAEHQSLVDKVLAGTRGTASPYPRR